jgi:hypothetical protein
LIPGGGEALGAAMIPDLSTEIVHHPKHFLPGPAATGAHAGLLAGGGPGIAQRAALRKTGFTAEQQQRFARARLRQTTAGH